MFKVHLRKLYRYGELCTTDLLSLLDQCTYCILGGVDGKTTQNQGAQSQKFMHHMNGSSTKILKFQRNN